MTATLATITPVNKQIASVTTGPVTALGIDNRGGFSVRVNLGGVLFDIIPPGTNRTYPLANATGYGGYVLLVPVLDKASISEPARLGTQIIITSYGGGDVIPYGTATQPGEMAASADLYSYDAYLAAMFQRRYDVRLFGAQGDGVTDDSAAIRAVCDAARLAGAGTVYLPAGTYLVSPVQSATNGANFAALFLGSGCALRGDGASATVIRLATNSRNQCWIVSNYNLSSNLDSNITVADLTIDGNSNNQAAVDAQYGLVLSGVRGAMIRNVILTRIYGTNGGGNGPNGTPGEGFFTNCNNCADVTYVDCQCQGDNTAPSSSGFTANYSNNVRYVGCTAYGMKSSMGFTSFHCSHMLHSACHAYKCGIDGFHNEFVVHAIYVGCVAGGITDDLNPGPIGPVNTTLGNTATGFHHFSPLRVQMAACHSRSNGNYGVMVDQAQVGAVVEISGGSYDNNTYGIRLQDAASVTATHIEGRPEFTGNASAPIWFNAAIAGMDVLTAPAVPATTVGLVNPFPFAVTIYISGGTVTVINIKGQGNPAANTGLTSGTFRLPAGGTITLTYTVAPTWVWAGF